MRKLILWIFGVLPAAAMLLYSAVTGVGVLVATLGAPMLGSLFLVFYAVAAWGSATVILVILDKPPDKARYGLYAAIVAPVFILLKGLSGLTSVPDLLVFLAALSLLSVTVRLIATRAYLPDSQQNP